jgi:dTDP-4-amino-4,6-dideoxygalactose transaminase
VEDCSHAHFATVNGQRVGTIGNAGVFSTNQKALTSGEGGFLLTNDRRTYERAILFGHYNDRARAEVREASLQRYALTGLGLKYRATTLAAAILINQLGKAQEIEDRRRQNYECFFDAVARHGRLQNLVPPYEHEAGLYVFPFLAEDEVTRHRLLEWTASQGCADFDAPGSTRPLFNEPLFRSPGGRFDIEVSFEPRTDDLRADFPEAIDFFSRMVKVPLWGYQGDEQDVSMVVKLLHEFR